MERGEKRRERGNVLLRSYYTYFKQRIVTLLMVIVLVHLSVLFYEAFNSVYNHYTMEEKVRRSPGIVKHTEDIGKLVSLQASGSILFSRKRLVDVFDKLIDLVVVVCFFSHGIRRAIMRRLREYKTFVRVNCTHIKEPDVNFMICAIFVMGVKALILEFLAKSKSISELVVPGVALVFRCLFLSPILIWMFSSVYNKTRWLLIASGYISVLVLIFLVNFTGVFGDVEPGYVQIPSEVFSDKLRSEIERLRLTERIFWSGSEDSELPNAALVKAGASRYVVVVGNLISFGKEQFESFIAHEIGHADDLSTEKKMAGIFCSLGISATLILTFTKALTPKYHSRGVSRFTTLFFIFMAHQYIISNLLRMFSNNLSILAEVNADLYAKSLGYGSALSSGLLALAAKTKSYIFPSFLYTHYAQDHPSISTRVEYLSK
jgi:Zn-dependent protease with chaperone function